MLGSDCCCWTYFSYLLLGLGALTFYKLVRFFIFFVRAFILPNRASYAPYGAKKGAWGVVTGASDGIGKHYALALARRGFNVCLISRTQSKLDAVAEEIEGKYDGVKTVTIAAQMGDLSVYEKIEAELKQLDGRIGVLINNVGISYSHPEYFDKTDASLHDRMVNVNIHSVNKMTYMLLPHMLENGGGVIINLSSIAGVNPTPLLASYSASKAYVDYFSQAINSEYTNKGIICQSITPGVVVSNMSKVSRTSLLVASPQAIAENTLNTVGRTRYSFSPFMMHQVMISFSRLLAEFLGQAYVVNFTRNQCAAIRAKALRRAEREAAKQK